MDYLIEEYADVAVYWKRHLDGGGRSFGQRFVPIVQTMFGRVQRLFEFCAGPGFIGFSLLASGSCETLCLSDVNPDAVEAARKTVRENGLDDKVAVYLSDGLSEIPDHERWDLVVGNPPHFCVASEEEYSSDIVRFDPNWRIHEAFYKQVGRFLQPHGSVILVENYCGSDESVFSPFLKLGNLELIRSFMYCDHGFRMDSHYFLWCRPVCSQIVSRESPMNLIQVTVSALKGQAIMREVARSEKVQVEVMNDLDCVVEVALQAGPHGPDQTIRVPQGKRKTGGIFLVPGGSLYLYLIEPHRPTGKVCPWCES